MIALRAVGGSQGPILMVVVGVVVVVLQPLAVVRFGHFVGLDAFVILTTMMSVPLAGLGGSDTRRRGRGSGRGTDETAIGRRGPLVGFGRFLVQRGGRRQRGGGLRGRCRS